MNRMKIGVSLECLGLPFRQALLTATREGAQSIQVCVSREIHPQTLSATGRREVAHHIRSHNLELANIYCPMNNGLDCEQNLESRIQYVCSVIEFARDIGTRVISLVMGQVPEKDDSKNGRVLRESLQVIFALADRVGVQVAVETGLESGKILGDYLRKFDFGSVGVTLDPVNLEINQLDAMEALRKLKDYVRVVHARDVKKGGISRAARETSLGDGGFDWPLYAMILAQNGYEGSLIVEREEGDQKAFDTLKGLKFLKNILALPI
ncbi:MAG: sugar phosphate isomerase/epimerase family protein [Gemmataceae bacterium]